MTQTDGMRALRSITRVVSISEMAKTCPKLFEKSLSKNFAQAFSKGLQGRFPILGLKAPN